MKTLWTANNAGSATGGTVSGDWSVSGISIDTRSLEPGDLFVALQDVRDGHDFVEAAYKAGAGAVLVSRTVGDGPSLLVDNTLDALTRLGEAARDRSDAFRCAVTGSVGKTSVKEMLARIFRAAGSAHWSVKSFNNHWGVPLTLARMPEATTRAVFEIGMSTPGEIAPRSHMVRPHAAMITKIAPVHLEGLGTEAAVADEKADIFAGLLPDGHIILPAEDRFLDRLRDRALGHQGSAKVLTFGQHTGDAHVTAIDSDGASQTVTCSVLGRSVSVSLNAVGEHWAGNAAAALLMASISGLDIEDAAAALSGYAPPPGRGTAEWLSLPQGGRALLVDDAYNANPESMRASLAGFASRPAQRHLVALGGMGELGPDAPAMHAGLAPHVRAVDPAVVFLAGRAMTPLREALQDDFDVEQVDQADALQESVKKTLMDGDALLIKGSNATGMGKLADALRAWCAGGNDVPATGREG